MQRCVVSGWMLWALVGAQIVFPDSNNGGGNRGGNNGFDPCRLCPCNGGTLNIPCPASCCSNSINRPIPNTPRPSVNRPSSCSSGCFQCFRPGQGQASCGSGCCRNTFIQPTVAPVQATCPAGCFRCNQFFSGQEAPCFSGNGCCRRVQNQNNQNALILPNFPTNPTQRPTTPRPTTPRPTTPRPTTSRPTTPRPTTPRPTTPPTTTPRTTTTTTKATTTTTTPIPTTPRTTTSVPESCKQGCAPCATPSRIDEFICGSSCCIITSSTTQAPPVTPAPTCSAGCFSCNVPIPGVQTSCGQQGCCRNIPQPTSAPTSNQCPSSCSPCDSPTIVDQITCGFSCCIRTRLGPDVNQVFGGKEYHFSWVHDGNQKYTQQQAVNYCDRLPGGWRIISIETRGEDNFVNNIITTNRLDYIWTGATRTASGWRWPSGGAFQQLNWSTTGGAGIPQPDNREPGGENCLAILNNVYNDGVKWHDIGCSHPKPTVCER